MQKKLFKFLFVFALLFGFTSVLTACDNNKNNNNETKTEENITVAISAPTLTVSDKTVSWSAVTNATGYIVNVNGTDKAAQTATSYTLTETAAGDYVIKVKAITTTDGYTNSAYSATKTITIAAQSSEGGSGTVTPTPSEGESGTVTPTPSEGGSGTVTPTPSEGESGTVTPTIVALDAPARVVAFNNSVTWSAVENATGYVVNVNGTDLEAQTATTYTFTDTASGDYTVKVKAITTAEGYTDSDYCEAITVTVTNVLTELPDDFYEKLLTAKDTVTISFKDAKVTIPGEGEAEFSDDSYIKLSFKNGTLIGNGKLGVTTTSDEDIYSNVITFSIDEEGVVANSIRQCVLEDVKFEAGKQYDNEYKNVIYYKEVAFSLDTLYTMINDAVAQVLPEDVEFDISEATSLNDILVQLGIEGITLPELPTVTKAQIASVLQPVMGVLFEEAFADDKITLSLTFDNVKAGFKLANVFAANTTIDSLLKLISNSKDLVLPEISEDTLAKIKNVLNTATQLANPESEKNIGTITIDDIFYLNENDLDYTEVAADATFDNLEDYYTAATKYTACEGLTAFAEGVTYYTKDGEVYKEVAADATFDATVTYYTATIEYTACEELEAFADGVTYYTAAQDGFIDVKLLDEGLDFIAANINTIAQILVSAGVIDEEMLEDISSAVDLSNTKELKLLAVAFLSDEVFGVKYIGEEKTYSSFDADTMYFEYYAKDSTTNEEVVITSENSSKYKYHYSKITTDTTPVENKIYSEVVVGSVEDLFNLENVKNVTINRFIARVTEILQGEEDGARSFDLASVLSAYTIPALGIVSELLNQYVSISSDAGDVYDMVSALYNMFNLYRMVPIYAKVDVTAWAEATVYYTYNETYNQFVKVDTATVKAPEEGVTYYVIASKGEHFETIAKETTIYGLVGQIISLAQGTQYEPFADLTAFVENVTYYEAPVDNYNRVYSDEFDENETYYVKNGEEYEEVEITEFDKSVTYYTREDYYAKTEDTTPEEGKTYYVEVGARAITAKEIASVVEQYSTMIFENLDETIALNIVTNNDVDLKTIDITLNTPVFAGTIIFDFTQEYADNLNEELAKLEAYARVEEEGKTELFEEIVTEDAFADLNSDGTKYELITEDGKTIGLKVTNYQYTYYMFGTFSDFKCNYDNIWVLKEYIGGSIWEYTLKTYGYKEEILSTNIAGSEKDPDYVMLNQLHLYYDTETKKFVDYDSLFVEDKSATFETEDGLTVKKYVNKVNTNIWYYQVATETTTTGA